MDEATRELWQAVSTRPGPAGTGRDRYAAAMAFWRQGDMPAEVLELYRWCALREGDDPLDLLAARRIGRDWAARVRAFREGRP